VSEAESKQTAVGAAVPAIESTGLCRRYGRLWALIDVNLRIPAGRVVMLTGRNGSGKSTLLSVLSTALRIDRGGARILGHDLRHDVEAVRRRIALLSHHSHLYEALTARENLEIVARFLDGGRADRPSVDSLLDEVGLLRRAGDAVATFSAGMRKRLSIARVLLQDAAVVMLDEPHSALDVPGFALVDRLLDRLRQRGVTVLMATHLLDHGAALCDEALLLEEGRLVWSGEPSQVPLKADAGKGGT
jgi:heme exporter protein A